MTSDPRVQKKNTGSVPLNNRMFSEHLSATQAEATELVTQICCNLAVIPRPKTRPLSHWLPRREDQPIVRRRDSSAETVAPWVMR